MVFVCCGRMVFQSEKWNSTKISSQSWCLILYVNGSWLGSTALPISQRRKAWENLMALLKSHHGPWVCIGDFNFVLNEEEIVGGKKGYSLTNNYLSELMFEFGAIDLGYTGRRYTWAKGKMGKSLNQKTTRQRHCKYIMEASLPKGFHLLFRCYQFRSRTNTP